jgi:small redox-active disulfide protein 2
MIDIKVVGPGCANCQKLAALCREVVTENDIEARIEKVTEISKFADFGIMLTPGLIINGKVMVSGKVPVKSTLAHWLKDAATSGH